jgi:uncharacterized protein
MNNQNTTLVIGASENTERYANMAVRLLLKKNKSVVAIGNKSGNIETVPIHKGKVFFEDIDTVTLYINPSIQKDYYDYILSLKPKRIIFNPGTENEELKSIVNSAGIMTEEACTLVLLNLNQY